jgi:hypothetical protein
MSYSIIQELLDEQLATVTTLPTLSKENVRYEPKTNVPYSRTTLLPTEATALSTHTDECQGLYQVDLFYPQSKGYTDAAETADSVIAAFQRGLELVEGGVRVHVRMAWRETALPFQQFYNVPVIVRWSCLLPRS